MIAVTSCDPGEGKTSVATNIAWALAAQDRHVTALDFDLRKPALHTQMGVPFGPGVTSRRTEDALAHASRTPNPYLDVIPAGIIDRHPSDIVSAHLPLLIEQLRERHDTAVIDCPPLIGVAETVLIATMVDLVIVVVDARRFNPERLQQCLLRLDNANANVAIVLNRVRFNRRRRDGTYGYGHFRRADRPARARSSPWRHRRGPPAVERSPGRGRTPRAVRIPEANVLRSSPREAAARDHRRPQCPEVDGEQGPVRLLATLNLVPGWPGSAGNPVPHGSLEGGTELAAAVRPGAVHVEDAHPRLLHQDLEDLVRSGPVAIGAAHAVLEHHHRAMVDDGLLRSPEDLTFGSFDIDLDDGGDIPGRDGVVEGLDLAPGSARFPRDDHGFAGATRSGPGWW